MRINSSQSLRALKTATVFHPAISDGLYPVIMSVEEIIEKFTKTKRRYPCASKIIKREELLIAGVTGDGSKTHEIWQKFMEFTIRSK